MGQFYGIKNDIFALSKHFFSQGGAPGGPLKNLNFFRGYIFLGAHKHLKKWKNEGSDTSFPFEKTTGKHGN